MSSDTQNISKNKSCYLNRVVLCQVVLLNTVRDCTEFCLMHLYSSLSILEKVPFPFILWGWRGNSGSTVSLQFPCCHSLKNLTLALEEHLYDLHQIPNNSEMIVSAFTLQKENLETLEAIGILAAELGVLPSDFSYTGIKDKKAITYQPMVVKKVTPERY